MIGAQGGSAVAADGIEAHQVAIGRLVQWVVSEQALGGADGCRVIALPFQQHDELLQRPEKCLAQAFALRQNPLVIATGQQIAAVERYSLLARCPSSNRTPDLFCLGKHTFEIGHVECPGYVGMGRPLERLPLDTQEEIGLGQVMTQAMH
jgi:hypothetical protein